MSISMLFEQINDIKQLFSETSKQLENEKLKTDQIRESISTAERDGLNYSELNSELTSEIARIARITQERQFSVEFHQQKREMLLSKISKIKEEIQLLQTKRDSDRSLFEKKIEEFNVDVDDEPNVVEQKIERTIVNVEGELFRAKKKLDALKESVATKRKKSEDMNSIGVLKNSLRDKQIEKQTQTEALTALERQINQTKKQRDDVTSSQLAEALESKKDLSDYCTALKRQVEDVRLTKQQLVRQLESKKSARIAQMPKKNHQIEPTRNELEADDESFYDDFFAATQVK